MKKKKTSFSKLVGIMQRLRAPGGCPWDRKQTHKSLLKYLKEESEEVRQAVLKNDMDNLEEELADLLLQVLFHADLARENKLFDIHDVVDTLAMKLVLRHPHVFEKKKGKSKWTAEDVVKNWDELKRREKAIRQRLKLSR